MNWPPRSTESTCLSVGAHFSAQDGACLMEVVSVAAGQSWSDAPASTHPLLGHLARLVNDTMSDHGRQGLLELVPGLARAGCDDPDTYPRLALVTTELALQRRPSFWLLHLRAAAARQIRRGEAGTYSRPGPAVIAGLYRHGSAPRAVEASVVALARLPESDRDTALRELLEVGLHEVAGWPTPRAKLHARRLGVSPGAR